MLKTTTQYIKELKAIMTQPLCLSKSPAYLDIAFDKNISSEMLYSDECFLPPNDPLIQIQAVILQTMQSGPFEYTRLGINELLKSYLKCVNKENAEPCTRCYFEGLYQLYLFGLLESYPYTELFWEYFNQCFDSVGNYLIKNMLVFACEEFLHKVSLMGTKAAQKNLPTGSLQHTFHKIEIWARTNGFFELADKAKNYRFNLEII